MTSDSFLPKIISTMCIFIFSIAQAGKMEALSDEQLGGISGQEGVLLSLDYFLNSDPAADGAKLDSYCSGNSVNCRFTWQIAGREDGEIHSGLTNPGSGEWLVYKDGYASLVVNKLKLDASFLGGAASAEPVAYEGFFNAAKFQGVDSQGEAVCLLEGGCTESNIRNTPALKTHYSNSDPGSYDPGSGTVTGYNDVLFGMRFDRLAIEYDTAGVPGYNLDNNGSFMGLNIADNNGPQAKISFGGDFYMYGF